MKPRLSSFKKCFFISVGLLLNIVAMAQTPISLGTPTDSLVTDTNHVTFTWSGLPAAVSYHLQVATDFNFNNIVVSKSSLTSAQFDTTFNQQDIYYWRVRYFDGSNYSSWSRVRRFTIFFVNGQNGLITWYKSAAGISLHGNGRVATWEDLSGFSNDASQIASTKGPLLVNNVRTLSNHPVLRFDGTDDFLAFANNLSTIRTVFWVIKDSDTNPKGFYRSLLGDSNSQPDFHRGCCTGNFPGPDKYIYDETYASNAVINGSTRLNHTEVNPLITNAPTEYGIISTKTTANAEADNFSRDRSLDGGKRVWWGDLAELIIFNQPLSDSLISLVEYYLHDKYSPKANLGPDQYYAHKLCDTIVLDPGDHFIDYQWSTGIDDTLSTITVTQSGTYWVRVMDIFKRVSYDTITVSFPELKGLSDTTLCLGDTISWLPIAGPYSYKWSDADNASPKLIYSPGIYMATVTDTTGCSVQTVAPVVAVDSISAKISLGPDNTICSGQIVELVSGKDYVETYVWNNGVTDSSISVTTDGTYSVTVTSSNGCKADDSISLTVGLPAPVADFTFSKTCLHDTTIFSNGSSIVTPYSIVKWEYRFGDNDSSNLPSPNHVYQNSGSFNVKLTVTADNGCISSRNKVVKVYPLPEAYFNDTLACVNTFKMFSDLSTSPNGSITSWLWDFDNGISRAGKNPTILYANAGTYNVELIVKDTFNCRDTFSRDVEVVPPLDTVLTPSLVTPSHNIILSSDSVRFTWTPAAPPGGAYYQLFIDNSSSFNNPDIVELTKSDTTLILSPGTYYWKITAFNLCGASTESGEVRSFEIFAPDQFNGMCLWYKADRGITKDINNDLVNWADQSGSNNPGIQPDQTQRPEFIPGNLNPQINYKPLLRFDGVDEHLIFTNPLYFIRTVFWVIKEDTDASFNYRSLLGDFQQEPDFHRGINGFPGSVKYIYDDQYANPRVAYGDTWVNGKVADPVLKDTVPSRMSIITTRPFAQGNDTVKAENFSKDRNFKNNLGQYRVWDGDLAELMIFCSPLSDQQIVKVEKYLQNKYAPPVNLGPDIYVDYGFCNEVTLDASERFVDYLWSTGDTTTTISANANGYYSVTVSDIFGATSTDRVFVRFPLKRFPKDTAFCYNSSITLNPLLEPALYEFLWSTGSTAPSIVVDSAGDYSINITDTNGCVFNSGTISVALDNFEQNATLGEDDTLCIGNSLSLKIGKETARNYLWSNGSSAPQLEVAYPGGTYSVTVTNRNQCVARDTIDVEVKNVIVPSVMFTNEGPCVDSEISFTDNSSAFNDAIDSWLWDFGDTTFSNLPNPDHTYDNTGFYTVSLSVTTDSGCVNQSQKPIQVHALPTPEFSYDVLKCAGEQVNFYDESQAPAGDAIEFWDWNFGDNNTDTRQNPWNQYPAAENSIYYEVALTVTTDIGCKETKVDTVEIFPGLTVDFSVENLCFDSPFSTKFRGISPDSTSIYDNEWKWNVGGFSRTGKIVTRDFTSKGDYDITLQVTNALGCNSSITKTITLFESPVADFSAQDICTGATFQLFDNSMQVQTDPITSWKWEIEDHPVLIHEKNPIYSFDSAGSYNILLTIGTQSGCQTLVSKSITAVAPPTADFSFDPVFGELPLPVDFTNNSQEASSYWWIFGDQTFSDEESPTHTYLENTVENDTARIFLIATNDFGCSDTIGPKLLTIGETTLDLAITDINISSIPENECDYLIEIQADVTNLGTQKVNSFEIRANINQEVTIKENVEQNVTNTLPYTFTSKITITECDDNIPVCVEVKYPNGVEEDDNPLNDKRCTSIEPKLEILTPYPNPANEHIMLDIIVPAKDEIQIKAYDYLGKRIDNIYEGPVERGLRSFSFDVSLLSSALYVFKVSYRDEIYSVKFTVRH